MRYLGICGVSGAGKAQPNDNIIYTPDGFKTIGELKVGDYVINQQGNYSIIDGIFPQGKKEVFKVIFNDDTEMLCNEEHLFKVYNNRTSYIKSVKELKDDLSYNCKDGAIKLKWYIPMCEPVNFKHQDYFIDPYILGVLIGDGYLKELHITNEEIDIIQRVESKLNNEYKLHKEKGSENHKRATTYRISRKHNTCNLNSNKYKEELINLNLFYAKSEDKFIPDLYKYNDINTRLEILRGLIDTDGSIEKKHCIYYYTCSKKLADDIKFIVESLGGNCLLHEKKTTFTYKGEKKEGKLQYRLFIKLPLNLVPFTSKKHTEKYIAPKKYIKPLRKIKSIESLNYETEMTCIHLNDDNHLYLTNNFIVTHNTCLMHNLIREYPSVFYKLEQCTTRDIRDDERGDAYLWLNSKRDFYKLEHLLIAKTSVRGELYGTIPEERDEQIGILILNTAGLLDLINNSQLNRDEYYIVGLDKTEAEVVREGRDEEYIKKEREVLEYADIIFTLNKGEYANPKRIMEEVTEYFGISVEE